MPTVEEKNNILKFDDSHKQLPAPFAIYADFEAITEKIQTCLPNASRSVYASLSNHTNCGYAYRVGCCYYEQNTKTVQSYRGPGAARKFLEKMIMETRYCQQTVQRHFNKPLIMTREDGESFQKKDEVRVRDLCHVTGKY